MKSALINVVIVGAVDLFAAALCAAAEQKRRLRVWLPFMLYLFKQVDYLIVSVFWKKTKSEEAGSLFPLTNEAIINKEPCIPCGLRMSWRPWLRKGTSGLPFSVCCHKNLDLDKSSKIDG